MNKKVIGIIIGVVVVLVAIIGFVMISNSSSKTNVQESNNKQEVLSNTPITNKENNENEKTSKPSNNNSESNSGKTSSNGKILIAFFSRADENYSVGTVEVGNTEIMAGFIKDYLGNNADTFKIEPVNAYPTNYRECTDVAKEEQNNKARPNFKGDLDISKYDTIFIGYPIWWGDVPMIINTFLEKYNFSGKTIIPFCTHEGSGNAGTFTSLKNKLTSSTVNTNGLAIRGAEARKESSRSTVEKWLKELGL